MRRARVVFPAPPFVVAMVMMLTMNLASYIGQVPMKRGYYKPWTIGTYKNIKHGS